MTLEQRLVPAGEAGVLGSPAPQTEPVIQPGFKALSEGPEATSVLNAGAGTVARRRGFHLPHIPTPRLPNIGPLRPRDYIAAGVGGSALVAAAVSGQPGSGTPPEGNPTQVPATEPAIGLVSPSTMPSQEPSHVLPSGAVATFPSATPRIEATPSRSANSTEKPKPSNSVTPTKTPETTQKPEDPPWYDQIPVSPYESVNDVPISTDSNGFPSKGDIRMEPLPDYEPHYSLRAEGLTILKATADKKNNRIIVETTTGSGKVEKKDGNIFRFGDKDVTMSTIVGGSYTLIIKSGTSFFDGSNYLGTDLADGAKYLKAGSSIRASIALARTPLTDSLGVFNSSDFKRNRDTLSRYLSDVGEEVESRSSGYVWVVNLVDVDRDS